jgi:hypothetical protein
MRPRLTSESRQPGMSGARCCLACRAPLDVADDLRCVNCQPRLSATARMVGLATRQRRAEQERQIKELESGILRAERALRKWPST